MIISWLEDVLRSIMFFADKLVYGLIETVYNLLLEIAGTTIFTNDMIKNFTGKVYALVGIFMLFKVSFSVLTYIVNPDEFVDKNKGMGKLVSNILTSLVLLVIVPLIFDQAMDIQRIILKDDIIPRMFSTEDVEISSHDPSQGSNMAFYTFSAFYDPPGDYNSLEQLLKTDVNEKDDSDEYVAQYMPVISTVVGVVIVFLLISFCFDVAIRSIKLGFLKLLSPIPIIARIDPKKGNELFSKWTKTCVSTYLDLFIRLIAIFFAIYVISAMQDSQFTNAVTGETYDPSFFAKAFIILGALMFAKQIPKLIEDLLGVKMDGKFSVNPMNRLRQVPLVGAATTTAAALAGGAITGAITGAQAGTDEKGHALRGALQGMYGAGTAIAGKVPLMGGDGKNPHALRTGLQSGYKAVRGKEYELFNPLKADPFGTGKAQVDELKGYKYKLQDQQSELDADWHKLNEEYKITKDEGRKDEIRKQIVQNRSQHGKLGKHISTIDDQISDLKRIYEFDDSTRGDVADAIKAANGSVSRTSISSSADNDETSSSSSSSTGSSETPTIVTSGTPTTTTTSSSSGSSSGGSTRVPPSSTTAGSYSGTNPRSSASRTAMQERIEQAANYHEVPTREEHNERQDYYSRHFNDPAVSNAVDASERYDDQRRIEQSETNEKMAARIRKNNEDIAVWEQATRDPNVKIGDREQYFKEIERLRNENASLQKSIDEHTH